MKPQVEDHFFWTIQVKIRMGGKQAPKTRHGMQGSLGRAVEHGLGGEGARKREREQKKTYRDWGCRRERRFPCFCRWTCRRRCPASTCLEQRQSGVTGGGWIEWSRLIVSWKWSDREAKGAGRRWTLGKSVRGGGGEGRTNNSKAMRDRGAQRRRKRMAGTWTRRRQGL